jgi:hypothetical protein
VSTKQPHAGQLTIKELRTPASAPHNSTARACATVDMFKILFVLLVILLQSHALHGITGPRKLRQIAPNSPSLTPIISAQNPVRIIPAVKQSISFIKSAAVVNEQAGSSNTGSSNKAASVAYTPAWDRNRNGKSTMMPAVVLISVLCLPSGTIDPHSSVLYLPAGLLLMRLVHPTRCITMHVC